MSGGELLCRQALNGLLCGSFYALVALGYSLVYGVLKLMNFAHGEVYMAGSFFCLLAYAGLSPRWGQGALLPALLLSLLLTGCLGWAVFRLAYRPLLKAAPSSLLITAIGASLVLSNGAMTLTNGAYRFFPQWQEPAATGLLSGLQITLLMTAGLVMLGLWLLVERSRWGRAMRAVAMDREACWLMGIDVHTVVGVTFFIGAALAALAAGLACVYYGGLHYSMGYLMGIKAFTAAVIGGIGSLPGAMLGGLLLGLLEAFGSQWLGSAWKDVFAFALLVGILLIRPGGLLGQVERSRM